MAAMDPPLTLYMTGDCHLCEQARLVVYEALGRVAPEADIADDDALSERYGVRIPVLLRRDTGAELDWPFTSAEVSTFTGL